MIWSQPGWPPGAELGRVGLAEEDRPPGLELAAAEELIQTGRLRAAAEEAVGPLY